MNDNLLFKIIAKDRTKGAFRSILGGVKRVTKAFFSMRTALIGAAGLAGIGLIIRQSLLATDELGKLSRVLGISAQELAVFKLAADIGGSSLDTFARASRMVSKNVFDFVIRGTGEAADAFDVLGISAQELKPIMNDQIAILGLIADRFKELPDGAIKTAVAVKLFGGRAAEMLNVLAGGSEALRGFAEEAASFGNVLSDQAVTGVENANDAFTRLLSLFKGIRDQVVAALAPALERVATFFKDTIIQAIDKSGLTIEQFAQQTALSILNMLRSVTRSVAIFTLETILLLNRFSAAIGAAQLISNETTRSIADGFLNVVHGIDRLITTTQNYAAGAIKASANVVNAFGTIEEAAGTVSDRTVNLAGAMDGAFSNFFQKGKINSKSFVNSVLNDLNRLASAAVFKKIFGAIAGKSILGIPTAAVPGFAHGGAFTVGGSGGTDSKFVGFMATPGERVTVQPRGQQGRGGGQSIVNHVTVNLAPGVSNIEAAIMEGAIKRSAQETFNATFDHMRGIRR